MFPQWTQLRTRKLNLHRLFEQMQEYQFSKIQENKDQPVDEDERILQQGDIDRWEHCISNETAIKALVQDCTFQTHKVFFMVDSHIDTNEMESTSINICFCFYIFSPFSGDLDLLMD